MVEVDVTGLVACRAAHRDAFERDHGISLTYLPFASQVITQALTTNPILNGRWTEDSISLNANVNLGIAVSTDGGLMVPVVHGADSLSVTELALRMHQLAVAARSGSLKLDDVQGGTFTLDNTGALGSVVSVPIINYPQSAIVTTEVIAKRPVVGAGDTIVVRSMMNVCMSFDHRVCDGAEAGRFLADVKAGFEAITESSAVV
jgi:2-oxoisovalerate dehydrogenase E2 component (dihydrolipoyl transacylase)